MRKSWALILCGTILALPGCGDESGGGGGSGNAGGSGTGSGSGSGGGSASGSGGGSASGSGGASSSSSSSGQGGSGGGVSVDCTGLPLCDDFEAAAAGGPPDASKWAVVSPNCSGTGVTNVDGAVAHSGKNSVIVSGKGGYCNHVFLQNTSAFANLGDVVYGRFWLRVSDAQGDGHTTFMAMKETTENKDLRMGGQSKILMWNRESDDATLPALSPAGIAMSVVIPPLTWKCVEFKVDGTNGGIQTWVDGAEVAGLVVDGTPTQDVDQQWLNKAGYAPKLSDFKLGWESYAGQDMTLWFDDVALATQRIGCQ